jgi:hypothetical protein
LHVFICKSWKNDPKKSWLFMSDDTILCPSKNNSIAVNPSKNIRKQSVKVYRPYSLSKDALREERCPWLIKSTRQGSLNNVWHFSTPPHVWHLWPNTCSTTRGKGSSLSKEPTLIPCKSLWVLLTLKRHLERGGVSMAYKVYKTRIS